MGGAGSGCKATVKKRRCEEVEDSMKKETRKEKDNNAVDRIKPVALLESFFQSNTLFMSY